MGLKDGIASKSSVEKLVNVMALPSFEAGDLCIYMFVIFVTVSASLISIASKANDQHSFGVITS